MNRTPVNIKTLLFSPVPEGIAVKTFCYFVIPCLFFLTGVMCSPLPSSNSLPASSGDEIAPFTVPFHMPQLKRPVFPSRQISISEFGAQEGGIVKCTQCIQSAIDSIAKSGGGTVFIPKGKWLTGALHFENNINLHLDKDAELVFSQDSADYLPVVFSRHEDIECYKYSAFLYASGKENIAITGEGTLNGQGKPWWKLKTDGKL